MENKKTNKQIKRLKKSESDESLPFCMKAPGAEHSRAHDNDEPCDDGRTGNLDKQ